MVSKSGKLVRARIVLERLIRRCGEEAFFATGVFPREHKLIRHILKQKRRSARRAENRHASIGEGQKGKKSDNNGVGDLEDELVQYADDGRILVVDEADDDDTDQGTDKSTAGAEKKVKGIKGKRKRGRDDEGQTSNGGDRKRRVKDSKKQKKKNPKASKFEPYAYIKLDHSGGRKKAL